MCIFSACLVSVIKLSMFGDHLLWWGTSMQRVTACPVWNSGLTQQEQRGLERIQRTAFAIIRGVQHTDYKEAFNFFWMKTLMERRKALCLRFALKAYRNPKFTSWFAPNYSEVNTRSEKLPLKEVRIRTKRFKNSPIPYLNNLLNQHLTKQKIQP